MASPSVRTSGNDACLASKEDSPLKLSTWGAMTLAQVDSHFVELALDVFKSHIGGEDLSPEQLQDLPKFTFLKRLKDEHEKYNPLCDVFNAVEQLAETANRWKNIAHIREDPHTDHRPDIGSYCDDLEEARVAYRDEVRPLKRKRGKRKRKPKKRAKVTKAKDPEDDDSSGSDEDGSDDEYQDPSNALVYDPYRARTAWGWLISFLELKDDEALSGFHFQPAFDENGNLLLLRDGEKPEAARAQFVKYFTEAMLRQHRTHYYAFYIAGTWVRVFRWDRIGCLVSPAINLTRDPGAFYNILYRLARSNSWGFDETAVLASPEDVQKLKNYNNPNEYFKEYRNMILDFSAFYPLYTISCPAVSMNGSDTRGKMMRYLIGRHISGHYSPVGRCTRGYIALDLENCELVFFKDQWRCLGRMRTELDTYKRLHKFGVRYIATPVAGGDIDHHRTLTQDYLTHIPEEERHSQRVHTRLVTKEVGLILDTYKDSPELLILLTNALVGHWDAWKYAGVLHRDISVGNIMIDAATGKGFLNDWDLAKWKEDMENLVPASEPAGISGTMPFKSALSLRYPRKPPEVADDIESFVHVGVFMGMRFHWHSWSPENRKVPETREARDKFNNANSGLAAAANSYFFQDEPVGKGFVVGGKTKLANIQRKALPIDFLTHNGRKPLLEVFLTQSLDLLSQRYEQIDFDDYKIYEVKPHEKALPDEGDKPKPKPTPRELDTSVFFAHKRGMATMKPRGELPKVRRDTQDSTSKFDHSALYDLLVNLFVDEDGAKRDMSDYFEDKAFDQFVHQGIITYCRRKNDSGMRNAPDAPNAREMWSHEGAGWLAAGRKNPTSPAKGDSPFSKASKPPTPQGGAVPAAAGDDAGVRDAEVGARAEPPPRRRTRSTAKANAEKSALEAIAEEPEDAPQPKGRAPAARKSRAAAPPKPKAAPKRRATRKGSPPPKDDPPNAKAAAKASKSRKAEAARRPPSPRKAAPAAKAKVTGKSAAAPKAAAVRAGRAGKLSSLKPEMTEAAPTRRSSRLAAQKGGKQ
ncbi:hypothetical protein PsYK624_095250 [Phanerochaete sordida]|uniref:Fungal-type protein kinase domain-containing protein n=1 Tax=Phanerochaete sordida TaxID=48140 RepID=A0A9P3GEC7_9APHY|nr:hypothetical protein PsYK624_095250 [Phanerochaete sordida]